jgi:hypothetical protein
MWTAVGGALLFLLKKVTGRWYDETTFTLIWANNRWGGLESKSGTGSDLNQTVFLRNELSELARDLHVGHLLDIPCGDFHWMKHVSLPPDLVYTGCDIVQDMITENDRCYGNDKRSFRKLDLVRDQLPKADLVLCRDGLVHFSFADIAQVIRNVKRSQSTYLLVTHFCGDRENVDIQTGRWRPLNLTKWPFYFPPPLRLIDECCTEDDGQFQDKCLGLWRIEDLPNLTPRGLLEKGSGIPLESTRADSACEPEDPARREVS